MISSGQPVSGHNSPGNNPEFLSSGQPVSGHNSPDTSAEDVRRDNARRKREANAPATLPPPVQPVEGFEERQQRLVREARKCRAEEHTEDGSREPLPEMRPEPLSLPPSVNEPVAVPSRQTPSSSSTTPVAPPPAADQPRTGRKRSAEDSPDNPRAHNTDDADVAAFDAKALPVDSATSVDSVEEPRHKCVTCKAKCRSNNQLHRPPAEPPPVARGASPGGRVPGGESAMPSTRVRH